MARVGAKCWLPAKFVSWERDRLDFGGQSLTKRTTNSVWGLKFCFKSLAKRFFSCLAQWNFSQQDLSTSTAFQQKAVMADWLSWWQKGMAEFRLSFKHVSDLKVSRFGNRHSFEIPEPLRKTKSLHFKHLSSLFHHLQEFKSIAILTVHTDDPCGNSNHVLIGR